MNNLFLLPVANTPAEPAPEGQPPQEGPAFEVVLEAVKQAEASEDLEEKTMAAPDPVPVAVPLTPPSEPASAPAPVQGKSPEPNGTAESNSAANSNDEAAAEKRPQASPQPAAGQVWQPMAARPPRTLQSPQAAGFLPFPGVGKEREAPQNQANPSQPNPSPDPQPARKPVTPSAGVPPAAPRPEVPFHSAPPAPAVETPPPVASSPVKGHPPVDPRPAAPPAYEIREKVRPTTDPVRPPAQGAAPPAEAVPLRDPVAWAPPGEKPGRDPRSRKMPPPGFTEAAGKADHKPVSTQETWLAPPTGAQAPLKAGLRPPAPVHDQYGAPKPPVKTAEHAPAQETKPPTGERPGTQIPLLHERKLGPVLIRSGMASQPQVEPPASTPAFSETPMLVRFEPQPEIRPEGSIPARRPPVHVDAHPTQASPEITETPIQDGTTQPARTLLDAEAPVRREPLSPPAESTEQPAGAPQSVWPEGSIRSQRFAAPAAMPAAEQPVSAPAQAAPAPLPEGSPVQSRAAQPAPNSTKTFEVNLQPPLPPVTQQEALPVFRVQTSQPHPVQTNPQALVETPALQGQPVLERTTPTPSPETARPVPADGAHLVSPGGPSATPEINRHLPTSQETLRVARQPQAPPALWSAPGGDQVEGPAQPSGIGMVYRHPLAQGPVETPIQVPAEPVPQAQTPRPDGEIPIDEMPKPAPAPNSATSSSEWVRKKTGGNWAQNPTPVPWEGPDRSQGVRQGEQGKSSATDPPPLEHIQRGAAAHPETLTPVKDPQPASEPARLAEAQINRIVRELNHAVLRATQAGYTSLHLQLHPEELGRIELELTSALDGLRITFTPDNPETGRLLASHLKDLQQSLAEADVQIAGLSIGQGQTKGTARHDTWRGGQPEATPGSRPVHGIEVAGDPGTQGRSIGWTSAVDYQI